MTVFPRSPNLTQLQQLCASKRNRGVALRRGHTLPELLVVVTIISLLAILALPRFISATLTARLDVALSAVRSDLEFARARAISTGVRHQFVVNPQTGEVFVEPSRPEMAVAANSAQQQQGAADVVLHDQLHEDLRVSEWSVMPLGYQTGQAGAQAQQDAPPLIFYPEGRSDGAVLVLEGDEGQKRGLRVDPFTGEIRELTAEEVQNAR